MANPRVVLFLLTMGLAPTLAAAQPALPEFTGAPVYVQGAEDIYNPVRVAIKATEAKSPRRYYVVVLGSTGEWNKETDELIEQLFQKWQADARRTGSKFETANGVLILLAIEQRSISVRTGQNLQQTYGLTSAVLDRDLVQRHFVPAARDGNPADGLVKLVEQIEARIKQQDSAAAARRQLVSRTLPVGAGAALLTAVLGGAGFYFWRGRQSFGRAKAAFDEFNLKLVQLMEQCDAIKQQHQLLPYSDKDFTEPMTGETLATYNGIEQKLANLRETWLALMDVRNQIEKLLATSGAVGRDNVREAQRLLAEKGALPNVEELYAACRQDLETLGNAHETTAAALNAAGQAAAALPGKIESLAGAGLATRAYDEQRAAIDAQLAALTGQATADPLGTLQGVQALQTRQQEVVARIALLLELDAAWRKGGERSQEIAAKVAEERASGLTLDESGVNPDEPISAAERYLAAAREALLADQPEAAPPAINGAHEAFDGALAIVAQVRAARAKCQQTTEAAESELSSARDRAPSAVEELHALERDFAPESWQTVAQNVALAQEQSKEASVRLAASKELATDQQQRYVAAAQALDQANALIDETQGLLTAIGGRLQELNALREQCAQQRGTLLDSMRQLESFVAQHRDAVDDAAQKLFHEAQQLEEQVVADLDSPRPNWPTVKQRLDRLAEAIQGSRAAAEADVRDRASLAATLEEAERLAARVAETLRTHSADRPRANQSYRGAVSALKDLRGHRGQWKQLLQRAQHAKQDLTNAEQWATEDIRLAAQAAQAIATAERAVGAARSFVASGISADTGIAATNLTEAQRQYAAQQFEQAITQADSAEKLARDALQSAEQAARMRQMQQEAERRRRQAERQASGPIVIPGLPTFNFGGDGQGPVARQDISTTHWTGGGGASHTSWSGGASKTKW